MDYPIRTLSQLRPILQGFRKATGLTQAAMAKRLEITQQSYAQLEARPASASFERLFKVLRLLDVDIQLAYTTPRPLATQPATKLVAKRAGKPGQTQASPEKENRKPRATASATKTAGPSAPRRIVAPTKTKENW
jgi:HTH-type transcriptional regulator/antitoxin HipB